jgi:hypothetical protein
MGPDQVVKTEMAKAKKEVEHDLAEWEHGVDLKMKERQERDRQSIINWADRFKEIDKLSDYHDIVREHTVKDGSDELNPANIPPDSLVVCAKALAKKFTALKRKGG